MSISKQVVLLAVLVLTIATFGESIKDKSHGLHPQSKNHLPALEDKGEAPIETPKDCGPPTCPNRENMHFPNKSNCGSFYKCSNYTPYLIQCPGGLEFNAVLNVCDWPSNAGCTVTCPAA